MNKARRASAWITVAIYPAAAFMVPFLLLLLFEILELSDEGNSAASRAEHTRCLSGGKCPRFSLQLSLQL